MVVDDRSAIVRDLQNAERKSPPVYDPARALFRRVLQGDLSFARAVDQARKISDATEKRCAVEVLDASQQYLTSQPMGPVGSFPPMQFPLPNKMNLSIAPVLLRHLKPERLMVLHFWRAPLSRRQLAAAGAILKEALRRHQPNYCAHELDFVSVAVPEERSERRFQLYDWEKLKPLPAPDLLHFLTQLCSGWADYQRRGPREFRRKREPSMFD
jgi:hypothetical protein